jgi:hypothetical protein
MRNTRDERLRDSITASFRRCFDTVLKETRHTSQGYLDTVVATTLES